MCFQTRRSSQRIVQISKENNIQVFVRVRPIKKGEEQSKLNYENSRVVAIAESSKKQKKTSFNFDKVFLDNTQQLEVYGHVVFPLVKDVLSGYNCTVFAYGQTGSGKTFTMEGDHTAGSWEDPSAGIIPRSLYHLLDELHASQTEYVIKVSFIEIYLEDIYDLFSLADDRAKLNLFYDKSKKSVVIPGLREEIIHDKTQVHEILSKGFSRRTTHFSLMNAHSSRSHSIFSITVHVKAHTTKGEEILKIGKLNLVDLAGSENIGRSGAVNERAREAGKINQSLLALGRCIESLVENRSHIPYRESNLTRLLQESLGGRSKTSIIATISPATINREETLSTLYFAQNARIVVNKPEITQKYTKDYSFKEIARLSQELSTSRVEENRITVEEYTQTVAQMKRQEEEIKSQSASIKELKQHLIEMKELFSQKIEKESESQAKEEEILSQQVAGLTSTVKELFKTIENLKTSNEVRENEIVNRATRDDILSQEINSNIPADCTIIDGLVTQRMAGGSGLASSHLSVEPICSIDEVNSNISADCTIINGLVTQRMAGGSGLASNHFSVEPICSIDESFNTTLEESPRTQLRDIINEKRNKRRTENVADNPIPNKRRKGVQGSSREIFTVRRPREGFLCLCGEVFNNSEELKTHRKRHNKELHPCRLCDASYKFKTYLRRHVNQAHGIEKPYKCTLCDTRFKYLSVLENHMKTQKHVVKKLWLQGRKDNDESNSNLEGTQQSLVIVQ